MIKNMTKKEKDNLISRLEEAATKRVCHYCGIPLRVKDDFTNVWGKDFYGRGVRWMEIDHKDAVFIRGKNIIKVEKKDREDKPEKCVLACALCNMAKSNMFTHDEFHEVGKVIREIWLERQRLGLNVKE